ncbi:GGDEF domain-containing protein [Acetobacterium woodii]|nr:GGDEF domain-containing protein [Acetobacterium woodii]
MIIVLVNCMWTCAVMLWFNLKLNHLKNPRKVRKFVIGNICYAVLITTFTIICRDRSVNASIIANMGVYILSMLIFSHRNLFCSFIEILYTFLIQVLANILFVIVYIGILKKSMAEFNQSVVANLMFSLLVLLLYILLNNNLGKAIFKLRDTVWIKHKLSMTVATAYILVIAIWCLVAANIMAYELTNPFWLIVSLVLVLIGVFLGITIFEQRNKYIALKQDSSTDELTGTMTRKAGMDYLSRMLVAAHKKGRSFNVCYLDINDLKVVNDNLGHQYGDQMICHIISTIRNNLKSSTPIIRMGGDEFLIAFQDQSHAEIKEIMDRILVMIEVKKPLTLIDYPLSFSYGIAGDTEKSKTTNPMDLITVADQKMYQYKIEYKLNGSQA